MCKNNVITMFVVTETNGSAKIGLLSTKHGKINTPTIFPVHNLGADAGWNTPKYWDIFPEINTGMFNASYLYMDKRNRLDEILEKGIHRYIEFPGVVFVDSGGFIYKKYNLAVSQQRVLELQEKAGADIASTLDLPIEIMDPLPEHLNITRSVMNAKEASRLRKDKEMLLFASIQGYDPIILRNVIRHLTKHGDFDGFAVGGLMKCFYSYRRIIDLVVAVRREIQGKPLHVYGLGGILITPLLIYLGVDSTDSSMFIIAAGKRDYIVPGFKRVSIHAIEKLNHSPCDCPICSSHSISQIKESREYLSLHNLWALWSELQEIRCTIREKRVEEYLKDRFVNTPWAKVAFEYAKRRIKFGFVGG